MQMQIGKYMQQLEKHREKSRNEQAELQKVKMQYKMLEMDLLANTASGKTATSAKGLASAEEKIATDATVRPHECTWLSICMHHCTTGIAARASGQCHADIFIVHLTHSRTPVCSLHVPCPLHSCSEGSHHHAVTASGLQPDYAAVLLPFHLASCAILRVGILVLQAEQAKAPQTLTVLDAADSEVSAKAVQKQLRAVLNAADERTPVSVQAEIGRGAFGVVYRGVWKNIQVAIKTVLFQVHILLQTSGSIYTFSLLAL